MARREVVAFTIQQSEEEESRWDVIAQWPGYYLEPEKLAERLASWPEAMCLLGQITGVAAFLHVEVVLGVHGRARLRWMVTQPICDKHRLPLPDGEHKCWRCQTVPPPQPEQAPA